MSHRGFCILVTLPAGRAESKHCRTCGWPTYGYIPTYCLGFICDVDSIPNPVFIARLYS
ncbi:hypothetical protein L873DRAFT_1798411 [Choiromyces venosus 120613-1]|uniref:Uncharacterized protein n=1 Tax=Choiromyces venosus 120613-1 TaxID=1336337 RepID=A0A3N4K355_9PEZI|nr:hypothetical protein L873DRAFT_1798411 [Choiromyces venosus 120613-1]